MRLPASRFFAAIVLGTCMPWASALAQAPAWWASRGVTNGQPADDYAVANIGQLKHMATQAAAELQSRFGGSTVAANEISNLLASWSGSNPSGDNYAAVNIGQLKAVAKLFYDRLAELRYHDPLVLAPGSIYPWTASTSDDDNYALANLGQLKSVFSFNPAVDKFRPAKPVALRAYGYGVSVAGGISYPYFELAWNPSTDLGVNGAAGSIVRYWIRRSGVDIGPTGNSVPYAAINNQLVANATYAMTVMAEDSNGNKSDWSDPLSATAITSLATPTANAATNVGTTVFTANWSAVANVSSAYLLSVSTDSAFSSFVEPYSELASGTGTNRLVEGLSPNTTYYFRIRALGGTIYSAYSDTVSVRTSTGGGDFTPPSVPTNLMASGITADGFTLSWSASSDNVGVIYYEIRRDLVSIGPMPAPSLSAWINNGISANTTYLMSVRAFDAAGNGSAWSNGRSVTTGMTNSVSQTVAISPPNINISVGQSATFMALGAQGGNTYTWGGAAFGSGPTKTVLFGSTGSFSVTVSASAGSGFSQSNTAVATVNVHPAATNQIVSLSPVNPTIIAGQSVTFTASGGQPGNGYIWGGFAPGSGSSRTISFPSAGSYPVTVYAPAGGGFTQSNIAEALVNVNSAGQPPVIIGPLVALGAVGTAISYTIQVAPEVLSISGYFAAGLPAGLSLNANTGVISGVPVYSGRFNITISAVNAAGTGTAVLALRITSTQDTDGDGLPSEMEIALGLDPDDPNDVTPENFQTYVYDRAGRLKSGPGRGYTHDHEGNAK